MLKRIKKVISILLIIILLPCIITIFVNGKDIKKKQVSMLDEYCIGILSKEVTSDYHDEMLKAQAVLVRTEVYSKIKELNFQELEISDIDEEWYKKLKSIWKETEGQVVMYNGELALVPFHQLSNGKTRDGKEALGEDYPYLQSIDCPKDIGADNQMHTKVINVSKAEILSKDTAGYVLEVKVGEEICTGESFRDTYGLESGCFELQGFENKTRVITKGVGHGLGLSQYTANQMAKKGKTYKEILQHFFPGTELQEVAEILWNVE